MQTPDTFSSSPLQLPNGDLSSYSDAHPPAVATIARMDVDGTDEESPEALKAKNARLREENALLTKKLAKSQAKAHQVTQFVALYKEQSTELERIKTECQELILAQEENSQREIERVTALLNQKQKATTAADLRISEQTVLISQLQQQILDALAQASGSGDVTNKKMMRLKEDLERRDEKVAMQQVEIENLRQKVKSLEHQVKLAKSDAPHSYPAGAISSAPQTPFIPASYSSTRSISSANGSLVSIVPMSSMEPEPALPEAAQPKAKRTRAKKSAAGKRTKAVAAVSPANQITMDSEDDDEEMADLFMQAHGMDFVMETEVEEPPAAPAPAPKITSKAKTAVMETEVEEPPPTPAPAPKKTSKKSAKPTDAAIDVVESVKNDVMDGMVPNELAFKAPTGPQAKQKQVAARPATIGPQHFTLPLPSLPTPSPVPIRVDRIFASPTKTTSATEPSQLRKSDSNVASNAAQATAIPSRSSTELANSASTSMDLSPEPISTSDRADSEPNTTTKVVASAPSTPATMPPPRTLPRGTRSQTQSESVIQSRKDISSTEPKERASRAAPSVASSPTMSSAVLDPIAHRIHEPVQSWTLLYKLDQLSAAIVALVDATASPVVGMQRSVETGLVSRTASQLCCAKTSTVLKAIMSSIATCMTPLLDQWMSSTMSEEEMMAAVTRGPNFERILVSLILTHAHASFTTSPAQFIEKILAALMHHTFHGHYNEPEEGDLPDFLAMAFVRLYVRLCREFNYLERARTLLFDLLREKTEICLLQLIGAITAWPLLCNTKGNFLSLTIEAILSAALNSVDDSTSSLLLLQKKALKDATGWPLKPKQELLPKWARLVASAFSSHGTSSEVSSAYRLVLVGHDLVRSLELLGTQLGWSFCVESLLKPIIWPSLLSLPPHLVTMLDNPSSTCVEVESITNRLRLMISAAAALCRVGLDFDVDISYTLSLLQSLLSPNLLLDFSTQVVVVEGLVELQLTEKQSKRVGADVFSLLRHWYARILPIQTALVPPYLRNLFESR